MAKVLIVDDETPNLELAEALITHEGHQAILASDGEMALKMVQENRPEIIMMDIVMPKMNGIETCHKIKTNPLTYSIPIIIVTAFNSLEEKLKAIKAGADDFIAKPFDRAELSARIRSLLRLKAIHDRLESGFTTLREMQREREELATRAAKNVEPPIQNVRNFLQAIAAERQALSESAAGQLDLAIESIETIGNLASEFAEIMKMEQDKLRRTSEALKTAGTSPQVQ